MSKYCNKDIVEAHKFSFNNMADLKQQQKCGCFYCTEIFTSDEIEEYIDDKPYGTALCPFCDIDSVIGESSGYHITEEFLSRMQRYWFESGSCIELHTPFGGIQVLVDDTVVTFEHRSIDPDKKLFPDVDAAHRINVKVKTDGETHTIRIRLIDCEVGGNIESGETLEAISFYKNNGKVTIGCYASFGDSEEYNLDYDGYYCSDGLKIETLPETQTSEFKFGVCWIKECTEEKDVQTWFGADPTI